MVNIRTSIYLCINHVHKHREKTNKQKNIFFPQKTVTPTEPNARTCFSTKNQFTINAMTLPNSIFIYAKNTYENVSVCWFWLCAFHLQPACTIPTKKKSPEKNGNNKNTVLTSETMYVSTTFR